jgi:acetyl esterase/lipase
VVALASSVKNSPWAYIPDTVSDEARGYLATTASDRSASPFAPEPDDLAGWDAARALREGPAAKASEAVVSRLKARVLEDQFGGVPVLDLRPDGWEDNGKVIVALHGGAWVYYSARSTIGSAALVADATGTRVISVDYTVAPRGKWTTVTSEVVAVIRALERAGRDLGSIALFGDSAGANVAGAVSHLMRDQGMGLPAALVLWSPCVDFANGGDTRMTLSTADPAVCYDRRLEHAMLAYASRQDWGSPYVSPIFGDFRKGFPPTLIQAGTREILLSDSVRLYQAIDSSGGVAKLDLYEGMTHVFQALAPSTPESKTALNKIRAFLNTHLNPARS